jgi:hypothetical protein
MKKVKSYLFALIPFLVLALTGCESVEENSGSFWSEQEGTTTVAEQPQTPAAEPTPTQPADETPPPDDGAGGGGGEAGDNTFLWKPVSETRGGRAAVLLPANISATTISVNGEGPAESVGRHNGNRQQFFLSKTGSDYGANVLVIAVGTSRRWTVPDGGSRWGSN